ncbi:MAG: hypothetical protein NUV86_00875 [Candidatus Scalindua sp.]|nr:hypothetical protein [Candidatus Scalindua sp.]MCR4343322.1 hypothetical protein [Candidatus Scalindua sp.]
MRKRVAINGFGRMGRLALRASWNSIFDIVHINELNGDVHAAAHLLSFDSIHGKWHKEVTVTDNTLVIDNKKISYSSNESINDTDWKSYGIDIVVDCTGNFRHCQRPEQDERQECNQTINAGTTSTGKTL